MANDNILAGLEGLLSGFASVAVPFAQKRYATDLEEELARKKQERESISGQRFVQLTGLQNTGISPTERLSSDEAQLALKARTPTYTIDPTTNMPTLISDTAAHFFRPSAQGKTPILKSQLESRLKSGETFDPGNYLVVDDIGKPQNPKDTDDVKTIAEGIKQGKIPPDVTKLGGGMSGKGSKIIAELQRGGYDYKKNNLDWQAMQHIVSSMNNNQTTQLRIAFNSVKNDIKPLRQLNQEFKRTGFTPTNKLIVSARLGGVELNPKSKNKMTPSQVETATKFITQINLTRDNMAVAFMRGGVPTDQAFKLTEQILNPVYGSNQLDSALDQVETNVNLRDSAVSSVSPYVPEQKQENQSTPLTPTGVVQGGLSSDEELRYKELLKKKQTGTLR